MSAVDGPVMLVTGGTGSIGSRIAKDALAAGWHVVVHGRSANKLAAMAGRQNEADDIRGRLAAAISARPEATLRSMSLAAGLSDSMLHKFMTGSTDSMTIRNIVKLANALDVSAKWLAFGNSDIRDAHGEMTTVQADMRDPGAEAAIVERAAAAFGRIDAVVDCMVTGPPGITGLFKDTDPDSYGALHDLSVASTQRLAFAAMPWLTKQGGTFIAFVSDAGRFAAPHQTMIGTARAATIGFVRNLALEVARDGVRVHAVSPSYVAETAIAERIGSPRMAKAAKRAGLGLPTPADIAPLVLFLCGKGARKITGQVISVNGGLNA